MLNVTHTLERMDISTTSVTRAIQETREILGTADLCAAATKFIRSLLSLDVSFTDPDVAQTTAFAVVEATVRARGEIDDEDALLKAAVMRAEAFINKTENRWMFAKPEAVDGPAPEMRAVEGTDLEVVVKADGSIKRGGKQQIAEVLFAKYVTNSETPCDNVCFVKILMKEAGMTLAGARTYAHNCRKAAGMI